MKKPKEPDVVRKERLSNAPAMSTRVDKPKKGKGSYDRNKHKGSAMYASVTEGTIMKKQEKFINFLEGLKGHGQDTLIESVKKGFQVCTESACMALKKSVGDNPV